MDCEAWEELEKEIEKDLESVMNDAMSRDKILAYHTLFIANLFRRMRAIEKLIINHPKGKEEI